MTTRIPIQIWDQLRKLLNSLMEMLVDQRSHEWQKPKKRKLHLRGRATFQPRPHRHRLSYPCSFHRPQCPHRNNFLCRLHLRLLSSHTLSLLINIRIFPFILPPGCINTTNRHRTCPAPQVVLHSHHLGIILMSIRPLCTRSAQSLHLCLPKVLE